MKTYLHVSNPKFRDSILSKGLLPSIGEQRCFGNELLPPAIFLTQLEKFDSTYDDDVYEVIIRDETTLNTDTVMSDSYYTFLNIEPKYIKLIYEGSGKSLI